MNIARFYIDIISDFVNGAMSADVFESKFIMMRWTDIRSGNDYDTALDELFFDCQDIV